MITSLEEPRLHSDPKTPISSQEQTDNTEMDTWETRDEDILQIPTQPSHPNTRMSPSPSTTPDQVNHKPHQALITPSPKTITRIQVESPQPNEVFNSLPADVTRHHTEVWTTRLEFSLSSNETVKEGIRARLISFIPSAISKCQGSILPWDSQSQLPPVRDLHTIIDLDHFDQYFKYDITVNKRIRGWLKLLNTDPTRTFLSIKHDKGIIKKALNSFPIYWNQTAFDKCDKTTPMFLACGGRHINLAQLKADLTQHAELTFPIDLVRKPQIAHGSNKQDPHTQQAASAHVIKISCAQKDSAALQDKLFAALGNNVPYHPSHQLSCLPHLKTMVTWPHGPYTDQMIFDTTTRIPIYNIRT